MRWEAGAAFSCRFAAKQYVEQGRRKLAAPSSLLRLCCNEKTSAALRLLFPMLFISLLYCCHCIIVTNVSKKILFPCSFPKFYGIMRCVTVHPIFNGCFSRPLASWRGRCGTWPVASTAFLQPMANPNHVPGAKHRTAIFVLFLRLRPYYIKRSFPYDFYCY